MICLAVHKETVHHVGSFTNSQYGQSELIKAQITALLIVSQIVSMAKLSQ